MPDIVLAKEYLYNQQRQLSNLVHLLTTAQSVLARLEDAELGIYADTGSGKISVILTLPEPDPRTGIDLSSLFQDIPGDFPRHVLLREDIDCLRLTRQPNGRLIVAGDRSDGNGNA